MRALFAPWLPGLAFCVALQSAAHVLSPQECLEGGDFIARAAEARDKGTTKSAFLGRLAADIRLIQAFPPEMRWFAADAEDAEFLRAESSRVFDAPQEPETHRAQFLKRCFDRAGATDF